MSSRSDEELIQDLDSVRDSRILAELMRRHYPAVSKAASRFLGSDADGQDVAQDTFARVFAQPSAFVGGNFKARIFEFTRRLCLDLLPKRKLEGPEELLHDGGPDELLRVAVEEVLQQLSRPQKACLRFFYYEGLEHQEISKITGYSLNEVRAHIQNGRARLKRFWDKKPGGESNSGSVDDDISQYFKARSLSLVTGAVHGDDSGPSPMSGPARTSTAGAVDDPLEDRYAALVERKYLTGLSKAEEAEMLDLLAQIDRKFDGTYEPVLQDLRRRKGGNL